MSVNTERPHHFPLAEDVKHDVATADEQTLRAQGHIEEMPRQFSLLSILGLAFAITNSWIAIFATFQQPLNAGGAPGVFYALLVASVACFVISELTDHKLQFSMTSVRTF